MIRTLFFAAALVGCATPKTPPPQEQQPGLKGVETTDLDRAVSPCEDFYQFANGAWRGANPIPASMQRWSRRWQAGEQNKEKLRDILEELSSGHWPEGSLEQLVSDHYASCIDEKSIDAAGVEPLRPLFAGIDKMQSAADVQRMIRRLHELNVPAPFAFGSQIDQHQTSRTVAGVGASGLGLPDRDYYLKPEPRFAEAREKYRAHVARILQLAGSADPQAEAETVFAFEKRLAEASLDKVARRNPNNLDHKTRFEDLTARTPHFDWAAYFDQARLPRTDLNVEEPKFLAQVEKELAGTPPLAWRTYLRWQLLASAAPWLSRPFAQESFGFNEAYLGGVKEMKPRWKRCAESTDELLGEALGRKYVERYFPPAAKARAQELVGNLMAAMKDAIAGLTWMGPATKQKALEKLATFNPKIGYPDKWKDYSSVKVRRDAFWA